MVNVKIKAKVDQKRGLYKKGDMFDGSEVDLYMFTDDKGHHHFAPRNNFDIVEDNRPIRTVTRREVVPGKYGIVTIKECGFIHINAMGTPEKLREAAHILNQIAEALEDGTTF